MNFYLLTHHHTNSLNILTVLIVDNNHKLFLLPGIQFLYTFESIFFIGIFIYFVLGLILSETLYMKFLIKAGMQALTKG